MLQQTSIKEILAAYVNSQDSDDERRYLDYDFDFDDYE